MTERDREHGGDGADAAGVDGAEARRLAVRAAASPSAIAAALADPDWRVRKEAALAAGRLASDPAMITALVDALLQPDDVGLRNAAIEAFAHIGARGATPLLDALERSPTTARKFVCAALGGTGPEGVPALARLARDPDPNTATVAVESLARIGGEDAEAALRDRLSAEDWVVRLAALEGLAAQGGGPGHGLLGEGARGARVPVATLAPMVDDPLLRRFAIRLLGRTADPSAAVALLRALAAPTSDAEIAAIVLAIAELDEHVPVSPADIADAVLALPEPSRESIRALVVGDDVAAARAAAQVLAIARDVVSLPAIASLAARAELGPGALEALRRFGHDAVRPLLSIEPGLDPGARAWALEAAAELAALPRPDASGPIDEELAREVRAALTHALDAREEIVVHAATRGLSLWAEPSDAELLVRVGSLRPGPVARAAGNALEALSHAAPQSVELALEDAPPDDAEVWSAAIAALPHDAALAKLRAAISSDEPGARRAALLALDRIDSDESAEIAAVALADEDVDVRIAAVTSLSRMRSPSAREVASRTLLLAVREESAAVRAAAARGLGALGDGAAAPALRELLRDPGPGVALAALTALRWLARGGALGSAASSALEGGVPSGGAPGRPSAVLPGGGVQDGAGEPDLEELLVDVLGHPDEEVVKEGLRAVAEARMARREARLALGLSHPAWDVRRLAASLLGAIGSEEARASLRERAAIETDDLVRTAIADALRTGAGA